MCPLFLILEYFKMNWSRTLRLCTTGKLILRNEQRHYTNRNILSLHDRGMFQEMFPDTAGYGQLTN